MLDETIDIFTSHIKEIVLKDKNMNVIPLAYLQTLDLPESIMHFFNQEIEIMLREEEEKFESDRFDYDQPEVRMLIDQIFDKLQQNAVFDLTRFNHLLERAIKLELSYIVEPQWTLTQFIFKDSDTVSTMEVYDTLKYFFKFEYYKNAISDYFNTKYLREIKRDQFKDLVEQIDKNAFSDDPLDTVLKTTKSVWSAFSEARGTEIEAFSIDVLYKMLNDRGLDEFSKLVEKVKGETEKSELTFAEIEHLLKNKALPKAEGPTDETIAETYEDIEKNAPEVNVDEIEVKESTLPEVEEEPEEEEEDYDYEEEEEEEKKTAGKANVAGDLADFVASQISSDTPLQDLNEIIIGRQRRKFLRKLFKKNDDQFTSFIDTLNKETSWKVASKYIDDAFYEREINPYSKEAIALSDIIYLRFFPKDKYVGDKSD